MWRVIMSGSVKEQFMEAVEDYIGAVASDAGSIRQYELELLDKAVLFSTLLKIREDLHYQDKK